MGNRIEFHGPPGAGKSTLTKMAIAYLEKNGVKTITQEKVKYLSFKRWVEEDEGSKIVESVLKLSESLPEELILKANENFIDLSSSGINYKKEMMNRFKHRDPDLFKVVERLMAHHLLKSRSEKSLDNIRKGIVNYQNALEYLDGETIIIERGLGSVIIHNTEPKAEMDRFTDLLSSKIDHAFFIEASPEVCYERQKKRGHMVTQLREKTPKKKMKMIERWIQDHRLFHTGLKKKGVPSYRVDNSKSLEHSKREMYSYLDEIIPVL